jgi:hypothetical protein
MFAGLAFPHEMARFTIRCLFLLSSGAASKKTFHLSHLKNRLQ